METVEFSIQIIRTADEGKIAGSDINARLGYTLDVIVPELLRRVQGGSTTGGIQPADYKVLIARQVTDTAQTLKDLQLQNGDYIFLIQPATVSIKLKLQLSNRPDVNWTIAESHAQIGRRDPEKNITPEIDLTDLLPGGKTISREQADLYENKGQWEIGLCQDAKGIMFIDQTLMEHGKRYLLHGGETITIGSLQSPELRLIVSFEQA